LARGDTLLIVLRWQRSNCRSRRVDLVVTSRARPFSG
jgi:hypothetical protein